MNEGKLIEDLARDITNLDVGDVRSFKRITDAIDQDDLLKQTADYAEILYRQVSTLSDQLRHRAEMMRRRAKEFDIMADSLVDAYTTHTDKSTDIAQTCEDIKDTLQVHAHIEPAKVT